jgi:CheY-like chemotaxis protein
MDLRIPSFGGDRATEIIKNNEKTRHIPVIMYSADIRIETIAEKVHADAFIKKPFDIDEFIDLIEHKIYSSE